MFLLGQGAQRPDCFYLTRDAAFVPPEDFVEQIRRAKDAPLVPYAALHFSEATLDWYANTRGDETRRAYLTRPRLGPSLRHRIER